MDIQIGDKVTYRYKDESEIRKNLINNVDDIFIILQQDKEILKIERPQYETIEEKKELLTNGVRIDIWTHFMRECIINYVH